MPAKNTIRNFEEQGIYYLYNKGLNKKEVFINKSDYEELQRYLTTYLMDPEFTLTHFPKTPSRLFSKNLGQEIDLICYSLMPSNFHFLVKIRGKNSISKLMKQLTNAYTTYYKSRYKHEGPVFQGVFKSIKISTDEELRLLTRYILTRPVTAFLVDKPKDYKWSNYKEFTEEKVITKPDLILNLFSSIRDWEKFMLDQNDYQRTLQKINHLLFK